MATTELYEIVYCSRRHQRRACRREYRVSGRNAVLTNVEILPPGYDAFMRNERPFSEPVLELDHRLISGHENCPFCNNRSTFHCECGAHSCIGLDDTTHHCPACDKIFNVVECRTVAMSGTGFTDVGGRRLPPAPGPSPVRTIDGEVVGDGRDPWRTQIERPVREHALALARQEELSRRLAGGDGDGQRRLPPPQKLLGDGQGNNRSDGPSPPKPLPGPSPVRRRRDEDEDDGAVWDWQWWIGDEKKSGSGRR